MSTLQQNQILRQTPMFESMFDYFYAKVVKATEKTAVIVACTEDGTITGQPKRFKINTWGAKPNVDGYEPF